MKAILILLIVATNMVIPNSVTVDRIEEGETDYAVVEVFYEGETKMVDVPTEDFNTPVREGERIRYSVVDGTFGEGMYNPCDGKVYYQFKSEDDTVWVALTENEIGFIPDKRKIYTLIYYDNGTEDCYECDEKYHCECEVYDDVTLGIFERREVK